MSLLPFERIWNDKRNKGIRTHDGFCQNCHLLRVNSFENFSFQETLSSLYVGAGKRKLQKGIASRVRWRAPGPTAEAAGTVPGAAHRVAVADFTPWH